MASNPTMEPGLKCIYDGTADKCQSRSVDIIAVHGLGANPDYAWLRKKDASIGLDRDINWLKELLPATLLNGNPRIQARVFCFNYRSQWIGRNLTKQRFTNIADAMLDCVSNERNESNNINKPLIFIGHSFGGLVIEKAIVRASFDQGPYSRLIDSLAGVVLLGTPHRGSDIQSIGRLISKCAEICGYGESNLIVQVDEKSMETFDMINDFVKIMVRKGLLESRAVVCFFENTPTNIGRRLGGIASIKELVVKEYSATIAGAESLVLDSDHFKLNKFATPQESNYKAVSSHIYRIAADAISSAVDAAEPIESRVNGCPECLNSLPFPNLDFRYNDIRYASQDTCEWIFSHAIYINWIRPDAASTHKGLLWIKGKPGSGKSTLIKGLFDATAAKDAKSQSITAAFFFNRRGGELENSPIGMVRSLLHQLIQKCPAISDDVFADFHDRHNSQTSNSSWAKEELYNRFRKVLLNTTRTITIFIDAVDECSEPVARDVVQFVRDVTIAAHIEGKKVRVCLSSRPYPNISVIDCPEISVESENKQDILTYSLFQLQGYVQEYGPEGKDFVKSIVKRSSGIFLWAVFAVSSLKQAIDKGKSFDNMRQILAAMPSDLYDIFAQTFEAKLEEEEDRREALLIWQWVYFSTRPLNILELRHAVGFSSDSSFLKSGSNIHHEDEQKACRVFSKRVVNLSFGLLEVIHLVDNDDDHPTKCVLDDASTRVQFIHESVREFLFQKGFSLLVGGSDNQAGSGDGLAPLDIVSAANSTLANACLRVMEEFLMPEINCPGNGNTGEQAQASVSPFLQYARCSWNQHLKATSDITGAEYDLKRPFWNNPNTPEGWWKWFEPGYLNPSPLLHWAAYFELPLLAQKVVGEMKWFQTLIPALNPCNVKNYQNQTPLHVAAARGTERMVRWLLDHGAAMDAQDENGQTPLHLTVSPRWRSAAMLLLLQRKANPNVRDKNGFTPLIAALKNVEAIRLLIKYGADMNCTWEVKLAEKEIWERNLDIGDALDIWFTDDRDVRVRKDFERDAPVRSPLAHVTINQQWDACKILTEAGALDIREDIKFDRRNGFGVDESAKNWLFP